MNQQISMFDDEPLELIEECLIKGSLTSGGKYRIFGASIHLSMTDFAKFLKEEYGVCGSSIDGGFIDYGPSGARIRMFKQKDEINYTWSEIAKKVKRLINMDRYLNSKEKEYIKALKEHFGCIPCPEARYGYGDGWA